jgi:hypothetical protein
LGLKDLHAISFGTRIAVLTDGGMNDE